MESAENDSRPPSGLDPVAVRAIEIIRANSGLLCGPIRVRALWSRVPLRGTNRNWTTAVELWLLEDIINTYRWPHEWPKWPLWNFNFQAKAKEYHVSRNTISRCVAHLKKLGLIAMSSKLLTDENGRVLARRVYVWPMMENVLALMDECIRIPKQGEAASKPQHLDAGAEGNESRCRRVAKQVPKGAKAGAYHKQRSERQNQTSLSSNAPKETFPASQVPPSAGGGCAPCTPDTPAPVNDSVTKCLEAWKLLSELVLGSSKPPSAEDVKAVSSLLDEVPYQVVLMIALIAWSNVADEKEKGYNNGVFAQSRKPAGLVKHWTKICQNLGKEPEEVVDFDLSRVNEATLRSLKNKTKSKSEQLEALQRLLLTEEGFDEWKKEQDS